MKKIREKNKKEKKNAKDNSEGRGGVQEQEVKRFLASDPLLARPQTGRIVSLVLSYLKERKEKKKIKDKERV